jgi:5-methylcytosine-specific restriction endonuclease McrA
MSVLSQPTLVLNKSWFPVLVENVKESFTKVFAGTANLIDEETDQVYDWETWLNTFSLAVEENVEDYKYKFIQTGSLLVRIPEVILLKKYNKLPHMEVKLTRRNLLIRDNFTCQYTSERVTSKNATIDHVFPRSRGGKTVWDNVVICSFDANIRKANRTPEEAGVKLRKVPKRPKWNPLYAFADSRRLPSWNKYINTDKWNELGYWDVELKE